MISIIVSSYNDEYYNVFLKSIDETIGVPYEVIRIENHNKYSLSKAYNMGAVNSKFDFLCFVHEDVIFLTQDWGKRILEMFKKNDNLGIIGLAGSKIKSSLPTGWGTGIDTYDRINLVQVDKDGDSFHCSRSGIKNYEDIKVLDGVFLFTKWSIWNEFKYDESIEGFHIYDIDFSLRVTQKYQGIVFYDLLLAHFSNGSYNSDWIKKNLEFHERVDKIHLLNEDKVHNSGIRRSWYNFLIYNNIESDLRVRYINSMGVDLLSIFHSFAFRFPLISKQILFIYKLFSFPLRMVLQARKK